VRSDGCAAQASTTIARMAESLSDWLSEGRLRDEDLALEFFSLRALC